ncbi:MAG: hypothetical protein EPN72_06970 [Nevskiaceae bacterium]|nr:MAG: hypothetical protein EPN63_10670 [Nevskiaceae bacterium]TBR73238.1 MAG: hypothetical protein EPN72_06970 [Nevskiaceae bacterium]
MHAIEQRVAWINNVLVLGAALTQVWMALHGGEVPLQADAAWHLAVRMLGSHLRAVWPVLSQFSVIVLLHVPVFWACWKLAQPRAARWRRDAAHAAVHVLFTWAGVWGWVLLANAHWFPHSRWSWAIEPVTQQPLAPVLAALLAGWVLYVAGVRVVHGWRAWRDARAGQGRCRVRAGVAVLAVLGGYVLWVAHPPWLRGDHAAANVVIIGIDSLRRDVALDPALAEMPNLRAFRERAFVEANVATPIARTFPSWVALLTGLPPRDNGARANLAAQARVKTGASLAWAFRRAGWRTLYAMDDTRFSNITPAFGFDASLGPRPGAADFLVGQVADLPLVNFFLQLPGAEHLLPSLVGNRALAASYYPQRFVRRLMDAIGPATAQPTLLAVHLCTVHWPFYTARGPGGAGSGPDAAYFRAAHAVDAQFGALYRALEKAGYINLHTLVVVLADHGEGLEKGLDGAARPAPVITHAGTDRDPPAQLGGHGGSLLRAAQWQTWLMLAGATPLGAVPPGRADDFAAFTDFKGSLLALEKLAPPPARRLAVVDRVSPVPLLPPRQPRATLALETGFRPTGFDPTAPDGGKVLSIASSYELTDDGRLEMKRGVYGAMLRTKDYGVTDGERVLADLYAPEHPLLVYAPDAAHWTVMPADRAVSSPPPLLAAACRNPDMRARLAAWCGVGVKDGE